MTDGARSALFLAHLATVAAIAATCSAGPPQTIQEGNVMPTRDLATRRSPELLDNRIGGDYGSDIRGYEGILDLGLKWVRAGFWDGGLNWQRVRRGPGEYIVDEEAVEGIIGLAESGVTIVLTLGVGDGKEREDDMWRVTPEMMDDYREYVRAVVRRLKDHVEYFEIWNEPDTGTDWGRLPPVDYARLVRHVAPTIREEAPNAKVVIGAIGGYWLPNFPGYGDAARFTLHREYLEEVLANGVGPVADVISWHPFYGHRPDDPYYRNYVQMIDEIRELAARAGFTGEYIAEEALWRIVEAGEPQAPVSGTLSAKYIARTMVMHLGLDITVTVSGMFPGECPVVTRGLCTVFAGATATPVSHEFEADSDEVVSYTFALPNGDRLIAVWTNGIAVDEDSGVPATLTCALRAAAVSAVDVLHGLEQDLEFSSTEGNTTVRDLRIPDYPLLIRLRL